MLIYWRIRYLDRNDRKYKNRDLFLDTDSLPIAAKSAVEYAIEMKTSRGQREILKHRSLFRPQVPEDLARGNTGDAGQFKLFSLSDYFENEAGEELTLHEIGPILTGSPTAVLLPSIARRHDLYLTAAPATPIPLEDVSLTPDEVRVLSYFIRDSEELGAAAFMKDAPGTITLSGPAPPTGISSSALETAATDDEIRSFVTIFRRLYMENDLANFKKAVDVFVKALGEHPLAKWVAGEAAQYESQLASPPEFPPFMGTAPSFSVKRLLDVFIYTQYAHPPSEDRHRQFKECLREVGGRQNVLTWLFLMEIWKCSLKIGNASRLIARWFRKYCDHHGVSPDIVDSLRKEHQGLGATEKEEDRKARVLGEKVEDIAVELWKQAGRPEGGPAVFRDEARDHLIRAMRGQEPG